MLSNNLNQATLGWFHDCVFASDSYFLADELTGVWRKRIDKNEPELWLSVKLSNLTGRAIRVGSRGRVVVLNTLGGRLTVAWARTGKHKKAGHFELPRIMDDEIRDFQVLGSRQDKLLTVSETGYMILYHMSYRARRCLTYRTKKVTLMKGRREKISCLCVDPKTNYLALSIMDSRYLIGSRILLFQLRGAGLRLENGIDFHFESMRQFDAFGFIGRFYGSLVLCGLTAGKESQVVTYGVDLRTREFNEVYELRLKLENVGGPVKMVRMGEFLYSSDLSGRLIQVNYKE